MRFLAAFFICCCACALTSHAQTSQTAKPWTFWHVMGSSMEPADITAQLEFMHGANIGGISIVPIYGEVGDENNYVDFLSPKWMENLRYISSECKRLGMGIDMTLGTGWPFGGKNVSVEDSAKKLSDSGGCVPTNQKVKRAAPGGEGLVLNPFSVRAMKNYASDFYKAFEPSENKGIIRAFYNDSYEVFGANYTDDFDGQFKARRGYDFAPFKSDLASGNLDERVWQDYHRTLSELLLDFIREYAATAKKLGGLSRYQAHGSPGNLCDLYAASDIPETESFGSSAFDIPLVRVDEDYEREHFGRPDKMMMKFASSAANVSGKKLVSSETATWLANHFKVSLSQIKPQVDELFLGGINHIIFHGSTYSPILKPFPGRLFYASTNFNYHSHFAEYLPYLCKYIERVQSRLQESGPDNNILLYFPVHAFWKSSGGEHKVLMFDVHKASDWLKRCENFDNLARILDARGYSFDFISDAQIAGLEFSGGSLKTSGGALYDAIVVPDSGQIPVHTYENLLSLARAGAKIVFENRPPKDVDGYFNVPERRARAEKIAAEIAAEKNVRSGDVPAILNELGICRETLSDKGLQFIRKKSPDGAFYFISNLGSKFFESEIALSKKCDVFEDPLTGKRFAVPEASANGTKFFLRLPPGKSCMVYAGNSEGLERLEFPKCGEWRSLDGKWKLKFLRGEPCLPPPAELDEPRYWTELGDEKMLYFSGEAAYSTEFECPDFSKDLEIDLGDLREMATVFVNGNKVGALWCVPYVLRIPSKVLKTGKNLLEIRVTNLSFNRIIKMDIDKVKWRTFREINFVDIKYRPFDASKSAPVPSGLSGEIRVRELADSAAK